ncbi:MAG: hypothetical protein TREMPRED_002399 [Tremellales sp. Tagirdzhanova-0007]|nr:MAG: hypothetical protein TREMPRED_002399 [Tremellales sp. Tagirdzhanova-0007]
MSKPDQDRTATEYLGLTKTSAHHPTDHPFRGPPLDPSQPRPPGNWVVILTILPLPIWTYFLLRYNVFGASPGGKTFGFNPALVPTSTLVDPFHWNRIPSLSRPGNVLVLTEAITAWMMAYPLLLRLTNARMTVFLGSIGTVFHVGFATISCAVFSYRVSKGWQSTTTSSWPQYLSLALIGAAGITETIMDWQRRAWKANPKNKGLIYEESGFDLCRHPNFVCFILYRSFGIALATGSFFTPMGMFAFQLNYFIGTVVPEIEAYMEWKYGEKWR